MYVASGGKFLKLSVNNICTIAVSPRGFRLEEDLLSCSSSCSGKVLPSVEAGVASLFFRLGLPSNTNQDPALANSNGQEFAPIAIPLCKTSSHRLGTEGLSHDKLKARTGEPNKIAGAHNADPSKPKPDMELAQGSPQCCARSAPEFWRCPPGRPRKPSRNGVEIRLVIEEEVCMVCLRHNVCFQNPRSNPPGQKMFGIRVGDSIGRPGFSKFALAKSSPRAQAPEIRG